MKQETKAELRARIEALEKDNAAYARETEAYKKQIKDLIDYANSNTGADEDVRQLMGCLDDMRNYPAMVGFIERLIRPAVISILKREKLI